MDDDPNPNQSAPSKTLIERLTHLLSGEPRNREEIIEQLKSASAKGLIDHEALGIILGAMHVSEMKVREVTIPRSQMAVVQVHDSLDNILKIIKESAHSRFPVLGEDPDEVIGILLAKDLLSLVADGQREKINIKNLLRPAAIVPESKRLNVLLKEFRTNRNHMAIVVDEYGEIAGLVTIEDVLEQIVGDIEDEHDYEEENLIIPADGEDYLVKALTPVDDFNRHFKTRFDDEEFDTIGGIVMHHFGHLPKRNESVEINNLSFKVLNANHRSIRLLQVSPVKSRVARHATS